MTGALNRFDSLFRWEGQFGYRLSDGTRNLNALRDGFDFEVPASGGLVLDLWRPDVIWREDSGWLLGLLAIAADYSRYQLACGRRFFTLLVLPEDSPLIGQKFDDIGVPRTYWNSCAEIHKFAKDGV